MSTTMQTDCFKDFRERYSILDVWNILGCPGDPKVGDNLAPWREERSPSVSIYEDGWRFRDHGEEGPSGDSVAFVRRYLGHPDWKATKEWITDYMGGGNAAAPPPPKAKKRPPEKPKGIQWPGELKEGTESTWEKFSADHGITVHAAGSLVANGNLRFVAIDGKPCYVVTDPANISAEIRKWGGGMWWTGKPQYPLEGVRKAHLIGADRIIGNVGDHIIGNVDDRIIGNVDDWIITEGVTDYIQTVSSYIDFRMDGGEKPWLVLSMLGAGCRSIDPAILDAAKGKRVVIAPDGDPAGRDMGGFWGPRFSDAGATVEVLDLPEGRDLRDLLQSGELQPFDLFA